MCGPCRPLASLGPPLPLPLLPIRWDLFPLGFQCFGDLFKFVGFRMLFGFRPTVVEECVAFRGLLELEWTKEVQTHKLGNLVQFAGKISCKILKQDKINISIWIGPNVKLRAVF